MWGIPAFLFLFAFFHRVAPGVFAKELMQTFGVTGAVVGLLSATYFYAYAGLMIPAGVLLDRLGVRRVVAAGGLVMGAGTLLMAGAPDSLPLFAGRFLVGAGAAVMFVGALKIATAWFPASYFATLSAATAATGVLGGLVATAPLAWLATGFGWRGALVVVGVVTFGGALLCLTLVRDQPDDRGAAAAPAPSWPDVLSGLGRVLGNRDTWPPFVAFFFLYSATNNLFFWVVPCLRDVYGLDMAEAALYATAPSVALLVAGPLTGFLSDRVLRRRRLPYAVLTAAQFAIWVVFVADARPPPAVGPLRALLRDGTGRRRIRRDLAARARGQPAGARRHRGRGREPRRVRRRRADPGPARRAPGHALDGRDAGGRADLPGGGVPAELRGVRRSWSSVPRSRPSSSARPTARTSTAGPAARRPPEAPGRSRSFARATRAASSSFARSGPRLGNARSSDASVSTIAETITRRANHL